MDKLKLFITSFILLISLFSTSLPEAFAETPKTYYLKILFKNTVLYHDEVSENKYIQVLNLDNEVIKSEVLKGNLDLELETPNVPTGKLLSYWDIQETDTHFKIVPVVINKKESTSTFNAKEGGYLIDNNSQVKEITKTYNSNTLLKDILPEVKPIENYKFRGWYIYNYGSSTELDELDLIEFLDLEKVNVTDTTKVEPKNYYQALFYKDLNNNDLDDKTEKIRLKFVSDNNQQIDDIEISVGESFTLPKLDIKNDHVFVGWYLDKEFKTLYDSNNPIIENTTLYAKWQEVEQIITNSEKKPITDENISNQIESILNGRLDTLEAAIQEAANNYANLPQIETNANTESSNSESKNNEVLTFTEKKYVFNNPNTDRNFLISFRNEDNEFLFSTVLPYGRTIRLLNQYEGLVNEYTVRQETTITVKMNEIVTKGQFQDFEIREVRENSSDISEVIPLVKEPKKIDTPAIEKQSQEESMFNFQNILALSILFVVAVAIILFIKKRKNRQQ